MKFPNNYPGHEYVSRSAIAMWAFLVVVIYFVWHLYKGEPILSIGNLQSTRSPRSESEYSSAWPYISVYQQEPGTNPWVQSATSTFIPRMGHPNGQEYIPSQPYIIQSSGTFTDGPDKPDDVSQNWYQFLNNFTRSQSVAWLKKRTHPGNAA